MHDFELSPKNLNDPRWTGSCYKNKMIIRAENSENARKIANSATRMAVQRMPDGSIVARPWLEKDLTDCQKINHVNDNSNVEAILEPAYLNEEWTEISKNIL